MKNLLLSFSVAVAFICLVGCTANSPKTAANKFLTSFYHMEYDEAKKVSTDDTKKMLDMFQQLAPMMPDSSKQQLKKVKIDIKDVKEEGDKATVTYLTSDNTKDQTLHLLKQNGKWMVQFSKQDTNSGTDTTPTDQPAAADTTAPAAPADTTAPATK